jgi:phospholipase/carboxylesterase
MTKTSLHSEVSPEWTAGIVDGPAVAVLLHGYGSNERDLAGLAPALRLVLPWVSLRAPIALGHGGAAWFAITTPGDPDAEPVADATDAIWEWIDSHIHPDTKIVPIGFSQGGLMASQLLRTRPERVVAPIILGGFVLGASQPGDDQLTSTRPAVFWGRGAEDRVITVAAIERTAEYLLRHSSLLERIYPGLAHSINADELDDVRDFLVTHVGSDVVSNLVARR